MTAELRSTVEGCSMVLAISNPEHRNALSPGMYAAGVEALNAAETNPDVRAVVLTGEGQVFCAGGNLQRLQANRQLPPAVQAQSIENLHNWIEAIRTFPKPVIAAVEGPAAGAGFSLALACGDDPALEPRLQPLGTAAASFVFRSFDMQAPPEPDAAQRRWLAAIPARRGALAK